MGSITLAQAALFAALAMVLLTGYYLVDNTALVNEAPALVLLGSVVPSVVWAGFFFIVYRSPASARVFAWITIVFAVFLEAIVAYIRFQHAVNYWTPFGNALSISGWLLRLGWTVFLISFALSQGRAPDARARAAALVLAIIAAPSALEAFWRVLITPTMRTIYWASQILFLWSAWGNPEARKSSEVSCTRFAP
jgi:hypothetical protein